MASPSSPFRVVCPIYPEFDGAGFRVTARG